MLGNKCPMLGGSNLEASRCRRNKASRNLNRFISLGGPNEPIRNTMENQSEYLEAQS